MIRVEGVEKRYGSFQAVHPLDLHVKTGEVFGFLGPNGAGKTTTIRMLSGVLAPTAGKIFIGGVDAALEPLQTRKMVGYIPDRPYMYEKLTAREFLAFIGRIYGMEKQETARRAEVLLKDHDLLERSDELIEAFSHGMKQRLVLSAALLHSPALLIVDEPMVGLDPHGARQIKDRFRQLADAGRTVFLSTHSLDVAEEVCDRVAILYKGRLVAMDTVDQLIAHSDLTNDVDLMENKGGIAEGLEAVFMQITEEERGSR